MMSGFTKMGYSKILLASRSTFMHSFMADRTCPATTSPDASPSTLATMEKYFDQSK
jgi:hypothetical protein